MRLIYSLILVFGFTSVCRAKPITFTFEVGASGSIVNIGGKFDSLTFRATGDTNYLTYDPGFYTYTIPNDFAEIDLGNAGVFPLPYWRTGQMYSEVRMQYGFLSFEYKTDPWNWDAVRIDLGQWDLKSSYGPVTRMINLRYFMNMFDMGSYTPLGTWIAAVVQGGDYPVTFTAIVAPEPSSICLCMGSIVLLGFRRHG